MTDEQINAAIAEACGWTDVHFSLAATDEWSTERRVVGIPPKHCTHDVAPDYCNDLNAMHEALKTLPPDQLWDVAYSLPMETMLGFMATARELAETFLMVIGKWQATTEDSSAAQKEVRG